MYERRQARIPLAMGRIEAHRDEGKDDAERSLEGLNEPVRPETAAHAVGLVLVIRAKATDATRDEVRRAPNRGNGAGSSDAHAEVGMEKERQDVVHGELDAEAHAVRHRHEPSVDVREANLAIIPLDQSSNTKRTFNHNFETAARHRCKHRPTRREIFEYDTERNW